MKRGKPLKRKTELKRGEKRLDADPEKVREFLRRGQASGARSLRESAVRGARRVNALRAEEGPLDPKTWRLQVSARCGMRCMVSRARADDPFDPRFDAHHPLPKRELRARGLYGRVWDPRNGILLAAQVHQRHENGFKRVPLDVLPASVWEFCAELDRLEGTRWATDLVARTHPPREDAETRGGR